jgi:enamine deaminase RidA (YjgF/YER057c/UK114 family)
MNEKSRLQVVQPEAFAKPRGFANGIVGTGRVLFVAGQIGWNEREEIVGDDFPSQFAQALDNVLAVVKTAGGRPEDVASMTVFVTDLDGYRMSSRELGAAWRARFGKHYPAMALIGVAGLLEPRAKVEIMATALLEERA